jgi:hypothetical protein
VTDTERAARITPDKNNLHEIVEPKGDFNGPGGRTYYTEKQLTELCKQNSDVRYVVDHVKSRQNRYNRPKRRKTYTGVFESQTLSV